MESSGVASSFPQNSRKRVFWGSSSSGADPEVIEIAPPLVDRTSNVNVKGKGKQKESFQMHATYCYIVERGISLCVCVERGGGVDTELEVFKSGFF
ncbi:hypothetical protein HanOQP8_Chr12g0438021 [Helianthus annuus]|nr:hypothetical protein HanOQP8_Chr12g0438021 [Helianthus annuus]